MKYLTFTQWATKHGIELCAECKGSGRVPCECECGASRHTRECGSCDGTGSDAGNRAAYEAQLADDRAKWEQLERTA